MFDAQAVSKKLKIESEDEDVKWSCIKCQAEMDKLPNDACPKCHQNREFKKISINYAFLIIFS